MSDLIDVIDKKKFNRLKCNIIILPLQNKINIK